MTRFKVGDYVYAHSTPLKPGKVIAIRPGGLYPDDPVSGRPLGEKPAMVTVKWINGTESEIWELGIRLFLPLIADHEKKLATHKRSLAKLAAL